MKILITGALGYIGSALSYYLADTYKQVDVICVDNQTYSAQHDIALQCLCPMANLVYINEDVRNIEIMKLLYKQADVIIPLAAIVGAPACNMKPNEAQSINYQSVIDMLPYLSKNQHVVFPNTNSGYGIAGEEICTEDSPLEPISIYGQTKCEAEKAILNSKAHSTVFRLATVFGFSLRMRVDLLVNEFVLKILTQEAISVYEPKSRRNFVHVNDVCDAFVFAIFNRIYGLYNLGNDDLNMNKQQLAERLSFVLQRNPKINIDNDTSDPDKRDYIVSSKKLLNAGFCAKHDLSSVLEVKKFYERYGYNVVDNLRNV